MKYFGQLVVKKFVEKADPEKGIFEDATFGAFYDAKTDVLWRDVYEKVENRFNWYIAVDKNGIVISAERFPEQCQIAGFDIYGVDDLSGFENQEGNGSVYGKFWNGKKIVEPALDRNNFPSLTPRQFWLAMLDLDVSQEDIVARIGNMKDEDDKKFALIELNTSTVFKRTYFVISKFPYWLGITETQFDDIWMHAAAI